MLPYYILSGVTIFGLFVLFLVLSKTLNGIINQLLKLEYMLQKECEFKKEEKEIQRMMRERLSEGEETVEEEKKAD